MQGRSIIPGVLILSTLVHTSVLSETISHAHDGDIGTHTMNYLGSVEGKHYFYEYEPLRTWAEAKEACNVANMRMTSITSEIQAKFLTEIPYTEDYTGNHFWTAGRDSQSVSQFLWDTDNITVSNPGLSFIVYYPIQSCLLFMSHVAIGQLYSSMCLDKWGTLCEVNTGE